MLETCCDILNEAYQRGWITSRDGNLSIRFAEHDYFHITPSGVRKQKIQYDMFKKVKLIQNYPFERYEVINTEDISGYLIPSGELPMHLGLQRHTNTSVRVVLHLHPTYCVAAMYRGISLPQLMYEFPELNRYTKIGPTVANIPPVTQELADACIRNIGFNKDDGSVIYNVIGMDRHGVISVDTTPWRDFEHIERLEHICKIVLASGKF